MRRAALILQNMIRTLGVIVLILGFLFWSHHAYNYVTLHIILAVVVVVLLWALSFIGFRLRLAPPLVLGGLVWGLLVLWFGSQMHGAFLIAFPGPRYEIARVLHFLIGLGAIGMAEVLGKRIKTKGFLAR